MPRNPKPPISYHRNPKKRSKEKLLKTVRLLAKFRFSTRKLILTNLKLALHSHHRYLSKLEKQEILEKIDLYSVRSKSIYILGTVGKEIANDLTESTHSFEVNPMKLNYATVRHHLAAQKAILDRINDYNYKSEHEIRTGNKNYCKIPDAILFEKQEETAIEVELTAKSDKRVYQAFSDHLQNILIGNYDRILYIFQNSSLKEYYLTRFHSNNWILSFLTSNSRNDITKIYREKFSFIFDEKILDYW